ncbi:MAG TPA: helicase-associated domain-containing protein [Ktedonobacterales bacterium]|nr:helicase-associated domain-containing protein [Ktedonobacterales bacterium]
MKSLSVILAGEPLSSLRELAGWWGAEPPANDTAETRQKLERAMRDTIAARFVWEHLTEDERRVLFAVSGPSARNWCLVESIPERVHLGASEAEAVLNRLVERHLVFVEMAKVQGTELIGQRVTFYGYSVPRNTQAAVEEKQIAYVPTELVTSLYASGREIFISHADRSDKTMDELLMPYRQGDLDQIGRRFGLSVQAYYSRNEVRAAIAENLTQAEAVRYALARVDERLRATYEWLSGRGGRATLNTLRAHLRLGEWDLSAVIHALEEYALAFDTFSEGERILFIPKETLANLRRANGRPHTTVGLQETEHPRSVRPADTAFLWDTAVLVAAAYAQDIELTRSGTLPKRAAQRLLPMLLGERARRSEREALDYVELLKQQAHDLGLVVAAPSTARQRSRLTPGHKLDSWARHDLVMQVRRLFRRWPTDRWWTDMPGANYREFHSFYIEVPLAREMVMRLLKRCRAGVWYSLASFRATLQGDDPYVLRPSQRCAGEAGFKLAEELHEHWEATDGEIITGMFRSTLYDLGMVALGYERDVVPAANELVNPDSFMLTELGAEVLAGEQSASEMFSSRALVVQPNFQVLLMEPYMPAIYWLVRFASLDQMGRVSRFTLTREALQRGMADGTTIDDVLRFLQTHSHKSLPQNVIYTLRDWARQSREAALPRIMLLEVSDEALAGELVTSPKLRAFRLRRVGPKSVAVPPDTSLGDLHRTLKRLGYAQKVRGGFEDLVPATLPARRRTRRADAATAQGA